MKWGKLIALYDDNGISIDGDVRDWFTDDTVKRFESYGWQVITVADGHDAQAISDAVVQAKSDTERPSLICCKTVIGFGSPNKGGKASSHGAPLGQEEIEKTRAQLGWEYGPFEIPEAIHEAWNAREKGAREESEWRVRYAEYRSAHPELAAEFERRQRGDLPEDWSKISTQKIAEIAESQATIASRKASQNSLNAFGPVLPELIGGSADLAGSNLTIWSESEGIQSNPAGNYIYFGVREFAMAAIANGLKLHGGFTPYVSTFLMFSEYARNALRMSALMKLPIIYVFTHDSIGLGEDGPTHQPVEQTATLRLMPGMSVWRPCDAVESAVAWQQAIESSDQPFSLIFSRQNLEHQARSDEQVASIKRGGYVLKDCAGEPELILIATGSEVALAMAAAERLSDRRIRVVSMPSTDRFDGQSQEYRDSVLSPHASKRCVVEAGVGDGWYKYVGLDGLILSIDTFGESGPANEVFDHFGLNAEQVSKRISEYLNG